MERSLELMRDAKTIAVVGVSSNPTRPSNDIARYLIDAGYTVYLVNPNEEEIFGRKVDAGKAAALNAGVADSRSVVLVFTDANTELERGTLRVLLGHFADPRVGAVGGAKRIRAAGAGACGQEIWYWRYEDLLKRLRRKGKDRK